MPFSLFLYVGGNSENSEKNTVCPAAASPSSVIWNVLFVFGAEDRGFNFTKNWVQFVAEARKPTAMPS